MASTMYNPSEERDIIKQKIATSDANARPGDTFFLINIKWWNRWKEYVDYTCTNKGSSCSSRPDSIDNSDLLDDEQQKTLKPLQMEGNNYALLPASAWHQLIAWYGGGPPIARLMIGVPFISGGHIQLKNEVEVYLTEIVTWRSNWPMDRTRSEMKIHLSRFATTKRLLAITAAKFNSAPHKSKIYLEDGEKPYLTFKLMHPSSSTLDDLKITTGTRIFFESAQPDGKFEGPPPSPPKPKDYVSPEERRAFASRLVNGASNGGYSAAYVSYMSAGDSGWSFDGPVANGGARDAKAEEPPQQVGVVGLVNLGNTCFMNSALQCLSNTVPLTEYFLQNKFSSDINTSNPLGMGGALAKVYAEVMDSIWKGEVAYIAPRDLKNSLAKLAPQFSGFRQHDSQEFLAFLLDGLHEDLNRVKKKPYVQKPDDSTLSNEKQLAVESWKTHLMRNNSVIVDLFQGQLKSTLVCPECKKISITFDPFMYLSVPLPAQQKRTYRCYYYPLEGDASVSELKLLRSGTIADLKSKLIRKLNNSVSSDELQVCDIASWKVFDYFDDTKSLSSVQPNDTLAAYQMQHRASLANRIKVAVVTNNTQNNDIGVRVNGKIPNGHSDSNNKKDKEKDKKEKKEKEKEKKEKEKKEKENSHKNGKENAKFSASSFLPSAASTLSTANSTSSTSTINSASSSTNTVVTLQSDAPCEAIQIQLTLRRLDTSFAYMKPMHMLFGMPLVISLESKFSFTVAELSAAIWARLRSFVDVKNAAGTVLTPVEPPFTLCTVNSTATGCSICEIGTCRGCPISVLAKDKASSNPIAVSSLKDRAVFSADFHTELAVAFRTPLLQPKANPKPIPVISLADCIQLFLTAEQLGPDDPWYRPQCKIHRQAMKKFDIWTLPQIVVVHLKRFSQDQKTGWREKLDVAVEYPVEGWDLGAKSASGQSVLYDLYAVVNHYGGLGGGHYTAYAKNKIDSQWYHFNDSNCQKLTSPSEAMSKAAYVLFYVRRDSANTK